MPEARSEHVIRLSRRRESKNLLRDFVDDIWQR